MSDDPMLNPDAGIVDELQAWYLQRAERDGMVFTQVIRYLLAGLYTDRDYLARRKAQGKRTTYDYLTEQRQKAMAWAIQALLCAVPESIQDEPEPPRSKKPSRAGRKRHTGQPSQKLNWTGPEVPEEEEVPRKTLRDLS
jgi:hypothetical protein